MDLRIRFRVREPRDVDLILGQGMLRAGWDAHNLNAPGKFLISAPGHDSPKRARAYLPTNEVVTETAARYAGHRPELDTESRRAILATGNPRPVQEGNSADDSDSPTAGGLQAGRSAQRGMKGTKLYRHLREHAGAGRAVQVSRGH